MQTLLAKVIDIGNAGCELMSVVERRARERERERREVQLTAANEDLVCAVFISQLWRIALPRFLAANGLVSTGHPK